MQKNYYNDYGVRWIIFSLLGLQGNIFVLRLSTQLVNFEENKLVVAMRIAQVVSRQFDEGKGICADDVKDFATPAFGFAEKDEA